MAEAWPQIFEGRPEIFLSAVWSYHGSTSMFSQVNDILRVADDSQSLGDATMDPGGGSDCAADIARLPLLSDMKFIVIATIVIVFLILVISAAHLSIYLIGSVL